MRTTTRTESAPGHDGLSFANALHDCLLCGVLWFGPNLREAHLTPEAAHILGLTPTRTALAPAELPEALHALAREVLAAGRPTAAHELELPTRSGAPLALRVNAFLIQNDGQSPGVVLALNNLTPARQLEPHLAQLDRLANAGTLAASMAHEIKNALVAGKTFTDLLFEQKQDTELVDIVRRELGRIDAIVTRMLRFAGPAPARPAFGPVGVHEVLEHSLQLVQHRAATNALTLNRAFHAVPDTVQGDDYELQQAFVNLFLNALDAMGASGTLTVTTETLSAQPTAATRPASLHRPCLRVTIQDTGTGIPKEHLNRLFEPFFTTKPTGTGLGLPITRRIIEEHSGTMTVESQPGQGTTFRIVLPTA